MKKNRTEDILKDFHQSIIERLSRVYQQDADYRQSIEKENRLEDLMEEKFTGESKRIVEDYHNAVCTTTGISELLAYRQGMRDMAVILGAELENTADYDGDTVEFLKQIKQNKKPNKSGKSAE